MLKRQAVPNVTLPHNRFNIRQRLTSATLMLGMGSLSGVNAALANSSPFVPVAPQSFLNHHAASHALAQAWQPAAHASANNTLSFAVSSVLHAVPQNAVTSHNVWTGGTTSTFVTATATQSGHDLNLSNASAMFAANSLAGFHTLTINVGGKQQVVNVGDHLTAAELVAAEQVLSSGKQQLTVNASGIASGGVFNLDKTTVSALDNALGGNIGSLTIGKGVEVVDSLATLNLTGSLNNAGSILLGASPSAHGQSADTITAANIYNAAGGIIQSGSILGTLVPTDIILDAATTFLNSGIVHSSGNLTINAASISNLTASATKPTIAATNNIALDSSLVNNTGTVSSAAGNVAIGGSNVANLTVLNSNGVLQAQKGTVSFNVAGNSNNDTITVSGGNLLSKTVDFEAGKGALQVNVGQLTGELTGEACSAHVTADTKTLSLGGLDVTGDPTYYNTGGDIVINTGFATTDGANLAIVASGNIIANGGSLDTSSTTGNGGNLTLIAGANFKVEPTGGSGTQGPDSSSTLILTNSTTSGMGSQTGGFIDLSGTGLNASKTNTPITAITTGSANQVGGNVLMVAYKGTGRNSGSVIDTALASQAGGANTIDTTGGGGTGNVTIIAPGSISGQNINSNVVLLRNTIPVIGTGQPGDSLTIQNGAITAGSYNLTVNPVIGSITQSTITATSIAVATVGHLSATRLDANGVDLVVASAGTSATPIKLSETTPTIVTVNTPNSKTEGSVYLSTDSNSINLGASTLAPTSTLSVQSGGQLQLEGAVSAGTVLLGAGGEGLLNLGGGVTATNVTLSSATGPITGTVAATNFAVDTSGAGGQITLAATAAKTTNILPSSIGGGTTTITANQPLKITGQLDITAGGLTVNYVPDSAPSKLAPGITLAAPINSSANQTGSVTFNNDNAKNASFVIASGAAINALSANISWAGPIGTSSAPLIANTVNNLIAVSLSPVFIKDLGNAGVSASSTNAVTIVGAGNPVNIQTVSAPVVTITNQAAKGVPGDINLLMGASILASDITTGSITITAAGNITADPTATISGSKITLTSTAGNIGTPVPMTSSGIVITLSTNTLDQTNTVSLNAPKGSVYASDDANATLLKAAALNDFQFSVVGSLQTSTVAANTITLFTSDGNLSIGGSLGGAKTFDIDLNSALNIDTTGKGTIFRSDNIELTAANNIGLSTAVRTQTPALSISAVNGSAKVINSGDTKLIFVTAQDLNVASTGTITTTDTKWAISDSASLTATEAIIFNSGNIITASYLDLNSPSVTVNSGASITVSTATSITSPSGLVISGGGQLFGGSTVQLTGTSVSLGSTAKGGNTQSPLVLDSTGNTANFAVTSKGNFNLDFNQAIYLANNGTQTFVTANIQAANIVNTNASATGPLKITTIDSTGTVNQQIIALTGTNAVTLGDGAGQLQLSAIGTAAAGLDGEVSLSTNGAVTLANDPYTTSQGGASIVLQGKSIAFSNDLTDTKVGQLFLTTTGSLLDISKNLSVAPGGTIALAGAKGVTIESNTSVSANVFHIYGPVITNNGTVNGIGTQPSLSISGGEVSKSAPLTISNTQTGSFTGFYSAIIEALGNGALKTGNLFTSASLLKDSLTILQLGGFGTGVITLSPLVQDIGVVTNGALNITGKSVTYTSTITPALHLIADGGNLTVNLNAPITIGKDKGNFDITGTQYNLNLSALGNLTINEPIAAKGDNSMLDATNQIIVNASTNFQNNGNAYVTVSTDGTAKTSTVINTAANAIVADHITLQRTSTIMPTTQTFTNSPVVFLQLGALNVANAFTGETIIQGTGTASAPLTAVNFVNTSSAAGQLTVEPITVTNGNLSITQNVGNMVLVGLNGSGGAPGNFAFNATNGNIVINDTNPTATITIFAQDQIVATATKSGLGNVTVAVGAIPNPPVVGIAPGSAPTPDTKDNGQVYWGAGNLLFNGTNTLQAYGSNIVFSAGAGTISVGDTIYGNTGAVLIKADPPAGASSTVNASGLINPLQASSAPSTPAAVASSEPSVAIQPGSTTYQTFFNQAALSVDAISTHNLADKNQATPDAYDAKAFTGASLFAPSRDQVIQTTTGSVSVSGGSVVLLLAFDGGLAVYNLHDNKKDAVTVTQGSLKLAVAPGRSIVLTTRRVRFFEEINPVQTAAYRNVRINRLTNGLTSFEADFSHDSLLHGVKALRDFATASDKQTRKAADAVLKTAAILGQLSGGGLYQYMVAPAVTASNF